MSIPQSNLLQSQLEKQRRQVDVKNYDITLGELVRMIENNEIIRAPEYQRKFRWRTEDESRLIESLFLGLPVPSVFVASNPDGTWEVVDGLQRLSTLIHFMSSSEVILSELGIDTGPLKLAHLKNSTNLMTTPLKIYQPLSDSTSQNVRYELPH